MLIKCDGTINFRNSGSVLIEVNREKEGEHLDIVFVNRGLIFHEKKHSKFLK